MKECSGCGMQKHPDQFNRSQKSPDGRGTKCSACHRETCYAWRAANPEKWAAIVERNKIKHGARFVEERKARYRRDRAVTLVAARLAYRADAENQRKRSAEHRRKNPGQANEASRLYRAKHPERVRAFCQNRRARVKRAEGSYTGEQVSALLVKQQGRCACCRTILVKYHADHIIPLASGGPNYTANIQLLCRPCNSRKSDKCPIKFMQERGFLL